MLDPASRCIFLWVTDVRNESWSSFPTAHPQHADSSPHSSLLLLESLHIATLYPHFTSPVVTLNGSNTWTECRMFNSRGMAECVLTQQIGKNPVPYWGNTASILNTSHRWPEHNCDWALAEQREADRDVGCGAWEHTEALSGWLAAQLVSHSPVYHWKWGTM